MSDITCWNIRKCIWNVKQHIPQFKTFAWRKVNQNESLAQRFPCLLLHIQNSKVMTCTIAQSVRKQNDWTRCSVWIGCGRKHYSEKLCDSVCHHDFLHSSASAKRYKAWAFLKKQKYAFWSEHWIKVCSDKLKLSWASHQKKILWIW